MEPIVDDPCIDLAIEAEIDRALEDSQAIYPPDVLHEMRCLLRLVLQNDAEAQELLRLIVPPPVVGASDKVDVRWARAAREHDGHGGANGGAPPVRRSR